MTLTRADGTSFWQFLEKINYPFEKGDFPFLTPDDPPRVKPVFDFGEYLRLAGRGEAIAYLYKGLGRTPTYVGPALDAELAYGFNDHSDRHTLWVTQQTIDLLMRAGMNFSGKGQTNIETELLATLVGMTHDLGNLVSRKGHSKYSIELLRGLFVRTPEQNGQWQMVEQAVIYHDEGTLGQDKFDLKNGHPLLWALVAADKMHVGRDRLGEKSIARGPEGTVEADVHVVLNMLISRSAWYIHEDTFVWHLDFSVDQAEERLAPLTNDKDRVWVPKEYQEAFRKLGIPYRQTFANQFLEVYKDRIRLSHEAIKLLFPWVANFQVLLGDADVKNKVGKAEIEVWRG